eukprot:TRINITY_DN5396_c0_g1_i1.p2 TRINITY_DN5396_c0_g1~~TRINITY_DN5396_c0_g1_i1.p2  ORF type:complete len:112 (+),score=0.25 TRINITY_DN5396_c0_g1_i1:266-601(+)
MAMNAAGLCIVPSFLAIPTLFHHHCSTSAQLRSSHDDDDLASCETLEVGRCESGGGAVINPLMVPMLEREAVMVHAVEYPTKVKRTSKGVRRVRWSDELGFSLEAVREFER